MKKKNWQFKKLKKAEDRCKNEKIKTDEGKR